MADQTAQKPARTETPTLAYIGLAALLIVPLVIAIIYMMNNAQSAPTNGQTFKETRPQAAVAPGQNNPAEAAMSLPPPTQVQRVSVQQSQPAGQQDSLGMLRGGADITGTVDPKPAESTKASEQLGIDPKLQARGQQQQAPAQQIPTPQPPQAQPQARRTLQPMQSGGFGKSGGGSFSGFTPRNNNQQNNNQGQ